VAPSHVSEEAVFSKYRFIELEKPEDLAFGYPTTPIPPTKYLFPSRENLIEFEKGKVKKPKQKAKTIIFGLNVKDLLAINRLDREFAAPVRDEDYFSNRNKTFLFSLDHFSPLADSQFDLHFFTPLNGEEVFEVIAGSPFGEEIINHEHFFKKERVEVREPELETKSPINHPEIGEIIAQAKGDSIWDELAEICFGCGICTYVCPVCYCFETEDVIKLNGLNMENPSKCDGCRQRRWDSCMLPDFANTAQANFRPLLRDRIYNWYHHKFVRTPKEHGFVGCVDCDRCIIYCPAKINFHETLNYLIKKYT